jgi:hypothetical protein
MEARMSMCKPAPGVTASMAAAVASHTQVVDLLKQAGAQ